MKNILIILVVLFLSVFGLSAQTNSVSVSNTNTSVLNTNLVSDNKQSYELTLGGSGFSNPKTGENQFGVDVSIETNPFKNIRSLWVGYEQAVSWSPKFAGYSDVFAEYSVNVYKEKVYVNGGWDVGATYATQGKVVWNTGPHVSVQYFTSDSAFLFAQVNYDFVNRGNNGVRYSVGSGIAF